MTTEQKTSTIEKNEKPKFARQESKKIKHRASSKNIYEEVTNSIIEAIEKGVTPWKRPWQNGKAGVLPLRHNDIKYQGVNVVSLWDKADRQCFSSPYWMTFKQAIELDGKIRKGEKSARSIFFKKLIVKGENAKGEEEDQTIPMIKTYPVFNASQIDGLPEHFYNEPEPLNKDERIKKAEIFFNHTKADVRSGGTKAFYSPSQDTIQVPHFESVTCADRYYTILAHEVIHWTGTEKRLNREKGNSEDDKKYMFEELVADIGASFVSAHLGLKPQIENHHAPYVSHYLKLLKEDKKAIFRASAKAQEALSYLVDLQPK